MQRTLIAGAGYLGLALAERLKGPESTVYLARRSAQSIAGMQTVTCDFSEPGTLIDLPEVDAIYYAVAADDSSEASYEKAYFQGVKNLIEHYKDRGLKPRFYLASSTSAYAATGGEVVTEDDGAPTRTGSSRFIVAGEAYLLKSGLDGAILRYGGIYGPGRTSLLRRIRDRLEVLTPNAVQYTNRIHRDDAVAMVAFLMEHGDGMGIYNAVDREALPRDEVILWSARALGLDEKTYPKDLDVKVPKSHKRVSSQKLQDLGYSYLYPSFREGYAPLIKSL